MASRPTRLRASVARRWRSWFGCHLFTRSNCPPLASRAPRSFAASTAGHEAWAAALWPRPQLLERQAQRLARRGDCRAAEATLTRVGPTGTYAWGPRLAVARCYARTSATSDARRMWHAALAIEPHLRALVNPAPERP